MTRSNIESCLAQIKEVYQTKDFLRLMLKLDIKIGLINENEEYYYKIWILRKERKKKVHITHYYHDSMRVIPEPSLQEILNIISIIVDVPENYEEYCMDYFPKPEKEDHLNALTRAKRFNGILDRDDVKSIPSFQITCNELDQQINDDTSVDEAIEYFYENKIKRYRKLGFTIIHLQELSEYNDLLDQGENIKRLERLLKQYGFDHKTGEFNSRNFPIPKSDKELEGIKDDITNFDSEVDSSYRYLEQLAGRYGKNLSSNGVIIYPPKDKHMKSTKPIIIELSYDKELKES